jgi:hypothetical protein
MAADYMTSTVELAHLAGAEESRRTDRFGDDEEVSSPSSPLERFGGRQRGATPVIEAEGNVRSGPSRAEEPDRFAGSLDSVEMGLELGGFELVDIRVGARATVAVELSLRCDVVVEKNNRHVALTPSLWR